MAFALLIVIAGTTQVGPERVRDGKSEMRLFEWYDGKWFRLCYWVVVTRVTHDQARMFYPLLYRARDDIVVEGRYFRVSLRGN